MQLPIEITFPIIRITINADSVTLWGLVVSIIALIGTWLYNRYTKRYHQLMLFNDLVRGFYQKIREFSEHRKQNTESLWDAELFNSMEYISYLANRESFLKKHVIDFLGEAFMHYKEEILNVYHKDDYKDDTKYIEWKKLCVDIDKQLKLSKKKL